ncbi:uncharacterized protein MYCGRDRAFT_109391 [Zymoseptoria tritici IPO323]|uniref:3-phytase n=1 Tax=Zymoseptoria tritici (strain CBS 115943 / IPO323) TaxID=336722 RepID=F9XAW5_ZYMTI|nr:uncharacterized protein MYCGRDRAFT_109391 [Zymoseptoria tritici IPO323]EGP87067.1 hypothetical protein MYCGRDRAFT_109391 [Zymoseptoria tritici IPO323]
MRWILRSRSKSDRLLWLTLSTITCILAILLYRSPDATALRLRASDRKAVQWNIKHHLGGISPWYARTPQGINGSHDVPPGCVVDQVHLMSRHAERFPTLAPGIRMLELYQRLQHANITFTGDLAFVNTWNFLAPLPDQQFEQLTTTGPYAGTLSAFSAGVKLRTKYFHLLESAIARRQTSFWASDSQRVIDTAKHFASGFFGMDWADYTTLHIIPETLEQGSNTLTPGRACQNYFDDTDDYGRGYGAKQLKAFGETYLPAISQRLLNGNPEIAFSNEEVYTMQEMCGFELMAKGSSQWCDVFTHEEWLSFEYARDIWHYYRAGSGNPYAAPLGLPWLNATTKLLRQGPEAGPLFFSFNHDGDIMTLLAALDLLPQDPPLPTTHVLHDRTWRMSDVTPMHGRIALERMTCTALKTCFANPLYPNHVYCDENEEEEYQTYVRIDVNDAIVPLPGCADGPGGSCPLHNFEKRVEKSGRETKSFAEMCGTGASGGVEFLHQEQKQAFPKT